MTDKVDSTSDDRTKLQHQHDALEREIADAQAHPSADNLVIAELKKRKLLVKEQIERLAR